MAGPLRCWRSLTTHQLPEGSRFMLTQEDDVDIHALRRRGWSISAIARHVGKDRRTVRAYLDGKRQAGVRAVPSGEGPPGRDHRSPGRGRNPMGLGRTPGPTGRLGRLRQNGIPVGRGAVSLVEVAWGVV